MQATPVSSIGVHVYWWVPKRLESVPLFKLPPTLYFLTLALHYQYQLSSFEELKWKFRNSLLSTRNLRRKLSTCFTFIKSMSPHTLFTLISQIGIYLLHENDDGYSIVSATKSQLAPLSYKQHSSSLLKAPIATAPIFTTIIDATTTPSISDSHFPLPASYPSQPVLESLDTIPNGPKPIEFYSLDLQDHERRAVDLESPQELWGRLKEKRKSELESSSTKKIKRAVTMRNRDHGKR
ncbi:hypothetical protein EYC80_004192 [Monilinia laxa]|uniref:Uncharacterized protein n=1 Tax=Monilinia laxa TaxID=61186 RepID=A0A5N6KME0_MONLA|nr:hypothetical protein EYC80_004192 [Monilinia laxa]